MRSCPQATSKRGFAPWAATTTLGDLTGVDVTRLTSQHFWDQMHRVPVAALAAIETALVTRVLARFALPVDTVLYDATNFFTFLATTNARATLPARGHNKQKRHDLRQVGVALCCTRGRLCEPAIPLFHQVYGGARADVRVFADRRWNQGGHIGIVDDLLFGGGCHLDGIDPRRLSAVYG